MDSFDKAAHDFIQRMLDRGVISVERAKLEAATDQLGMAMRATLATHKEQEAVNMPPRPMETAPRDCTMLWLLVDYSGEEGHSPLSDAKIAWTIGFNNFDHDEIDEWKFAGWNWENDYFTEGAGKPIGWLPIPFNIDAGADAANG